MATSAAAALPPGPAANRLAQGRRFHRDPLALLERCRDEYGDAFTLRMAVSGPMVVFANPRALPELLDSDPRRAHTGEARRRILGMVSPHSVLGADGERHRSARGRVEGVFGAPAVDAHRERMTAIAERHVARWPRGRPLRLLPRMRAIADEIFARLVVGMPDEQAARALAAAVQRMLWTPGNPPLPPPGDGAGLAGMLGKRVFDRRKEPAAQLLAAELDRRRRDGDSGPGDLIGCMLDGDRPLDTDVAVDQLLPLLMAGQEPPAAGLTWLLDRLSREPGLAEEFVELAEESPRRDAILREALRLRPAVHSIVRRLTAPAEIDGRALPRGAVAMGPIVLLHRDREAYPEVDRFRPERFLAADAPDLPHLPFGGGARRCLGEMLAHAEIATVIPAILRAVQLRPLSAAPERMVVRGTVLVPQRSGLAVASSR